MTNVISIIIQNRFDRITLNLGYKWFAKCNYLSILKITHFTGAKL
jgi:hypothetical protein